MKTSDVQQKNAQQPATQQRKGTATLESPQSEQIAQLEAMAESSPQADKLAQSAGIANNSPQAAAQRQMIDTVNNSSLMAAQRQQLDGLAREPVQREETEETPQPEVAQREEAPAKPNNTGLPDNLKSGIESLSGISMDNVKVHYNSSQPAQLNAHAYAQGTDIHLAPGQEQHLPHEAWHVVQQAQGRVQPTMQMKKSVPINDDKSLEHEADVMGEKAALGGVAPRKSMESNNQTHPPYKNAPNHRIAQARPIIQMLRDFTTRYRLQNVRAATMGYEAQNSTTTQPTAVPPIPTDVTDGSTGYVVNIATIPGGNPNTVATQYINQGFANAVQAPSRLAMVIGVNKYKSLSGNSVGQVNNYVGQQNQQAIRMSTIGFTWKQNWQSRGGAGDPNTWDGAKAAYDQQDDDIKLQIQQQEKANLSQQTIPYAQIKERVTASPESKSMVDYLSRYNEYVYIQLGDDDAVTLKANDQHSSQKAYNEIDGQNGQVEHLFDRYDHVLEEHDMPSFLVGGYEFRLDTNGDGTKGDRNPLNLDDQLLAMANQIDIAIRMAVARVNPDYAYPTEPNLVFLASHIPQDAGIALMHGEDRSFNMYRDLSLNGADVFNNDGTIANEGDLFGEGAREGQKLRSRYGRALADSNAEDRHVYDPRAALATDSGRFGLRDTDRRGGDKTNPTHAGARQQAAVRGEDDLRKRLVRDMGAQSQNFISNGLSVALRMGLPGGATINPGNVGRLSRKIESLILAKLADPRTVLNTAGLTNGLNQANARAIINAIEGKFNTMGPIWTKLERVMRRKYQALGED